LESHCGDILFAKRAGRDLRPQAGRRSIKSPEKSAGRDADGCHVGRRPARKYGQRRTAASARVDILVKQRGDDTGRNLAWRIERGQSIRWSNELKSAFRSHA